MEFPHHLINNDKLKPEGMHCIAMLGHMCLYVCSFHEIFSL